MKVIITDEQRFNVVIKWLNRKFGSLTPINKVENSSSEKFDITYYVEYNKNIIFYYINEKIKGKDYKGYLHISNKVWDILRTSFYMEHDEIQEVLRVWTNETYNIKNVKRPYIYQTPQYVLDKVEL